MKNKKLKIFFLYPNFHMNTLVPNGIAILSAVIKEDGFKNIELFDPTFYDSKKSDWYKERVSLGQVKPFNYKDINIELKTTNMYEDFALRIDKFKPDLIVASVLEDTFSVFKKFMNYTNDKKIPCLVGGIFPSSEPELVLESDHVDYVCRGEGEGAILDLCNALEEGKDTSNIKNLWIKKNGKIIAKNKIRPALDVNTLPIQDLSIFEDMSLHRAMSGKIYRMAPIETQRGCPYACKFCNSPEKNELYNAQVAGRFFRKREIKHVHKELKYLIKNFRIEYFFFITDTFLAMSEKEFDEFCEMYSEFKLPFWFNTRPETITERRAKKLKLIGCHKVNIGVEHGNEKFRANVAGRKYGNEAVIKAFAIMYNENIATTCNNIVGYPDETRELVFDTIELSRKLKTTDVNAFTFVPYHGTMSRKLAEEKNYIKKGVLCSMLETENGIAPSQLNMPSLSKKEIMGLVKTFSLYVRMPRSYWKDIEFSEQHGEERHKKYIELMKIYQKDYAHSFNLN